jgi:hypothetical protein
MAEARSRKKPAPKAPSRASRPEKQEDHAFPPSSAAVCQVGFCPICLAVTALSEMRPELTEHLLLAGREVLLALRAVIDSRLAGGEEPAGRLQRLIIE